MTRFRPAFGCDGWACKCNPGCSMPYATSTSTGDKYEQTEVYLHRDAYSDKWYGGICSNGTRGGCNGSLFDVSRQRTIPLNTPLFPVVNIDIDRDGIHASQVPISAYEDAGLVSTISSARNLFFFTSYNHPCLYDKSSGYFWYRQGSFWRRIEWTGLKEYLTIPPDNYTNAKEYSSVVFSRKSNIFIATKYRMVEYEAESGTALYERPLAGRYAVVDVNPSSMSYFTPSPFGESFCWFDDKFQNQAACDGKYGDLSYAYYHWFWPRPLYAGHKTGWEEIHYKVRSTRYKSNNTAQDKGDPNWDGFLLYTSDGINMETDVSRFDKLDSDDPFPYRRN